MAAPLPRRTLFVDDRGAGLRVTWHADRGFVVLSLWHDDVCAATVRLPSEEAARLAGFIVGHLGALAGSGDATGSRDTAAQSTAAAQDATEPLADR